MYLPPFPNLFIFFYFVGLVEMIAIFLQKADPDMHQKKFIYGFNAAAAHELLISWCVCIFT